jgi:CubicO group peptidase (beta-lactamase class C family)
VFAFSAKLLLSVALLAPSQTHAIESAIAQGMSQRHIPSAVVRVDRDGQTIYNRAFGLRNLSDRLPATTTTQYQYGSITKQFTAAAILLLAQRGKLTLDDPAGKWLPAFAKFPVTIRQLLVHVSGIADFTNTQEYAIDISPLPFTGPQWGLDYAASKPLEFTPGTKAVYDNSGYVILAHIVEAASGSDFETFLRDNFFKPLGMHSAHGYRMLAIEPNVAQGYLVWTDELAKAAPPKMQSLEVGTLSEALPWNLRQADGAGFLVGEAADLNIWGNALLAGKILHGKWRDTFYEAGTLSDGTPAYTGGDNKMKNRALYCYGGIARFTIDGVTAYGANGGTFGFLAFTATIPAKRISVTVLTNEGQIDNSKLSTPIMDALVH